MSEFIWSMSISFQLLFIIVSGVLYLYLKFKSFKFYSFYNIFLLGYVLSRLDANYYAAEDFAATFLGGKNAEIFVAILCLYIQIGFCNFYTVFALYFLDLHKHTKKFFAAVINILKSLAIGFFIFGVFSYLIKDYSFYVSLFTFIYIPVMLAVFIPSVFLAMKYSAEHKYFFLTGASIFVVFSLIAFAGSRISSLNMKNPIMFFYIGTILETIFFSLGLAFKVKVFNEERDKVRAEITRHKHQQQISRFQGLLQGEERERKRMAEELHDGIAGDLTAIKFQLSTFNKEEASPKNRNIIEEVSKIIDNSYEQIREISHNLSPSSIINYGLIYTLESFCQKIEKNFRIRFKFNFSGEKPDLSKAVQIHIYRIIQELVNNMLKHAQATEGSLDIFYEKPKMRIILEDNGKGFSQDPTSKGIGLSNIDSRIRFLNARLVKENTKAGTRFIIEINTNLVPDHNSFF